MSLTIDRPPVQVRPPETAYVEGLPLTPEEQKILGDMERMAVTINTEHGPETYYEAADPGYRRFFTRDSMKAAALSGSIEMLVSQLAFATNRIGKTRNPLTGEEPGKPPHEWPAPGEAVEPYRDGRFTMYNACDTGAILLQSIAMLIERGYPDAADQYKETIEQTVSYVKSHINEQGLFIEDPKFSGSTEPDGRNRKYGIRVTNWKDSVLNREGREEPNYPIVYTIVHFQNAQALQRIGHALGDDSLIEMGRNMTKQGLTHLWRGDHFVSAVDGDGDTDPPSTDSLEALLYIPPQQLPTGYAESIENYTAQLETDAGYRAGIPAKSDMDMYHMGVWMHSQAELNAAATLHGLSRAKEVTERAMAFIDPEGSFYPEIIDPDTYDLAGNPLQLWVMGAGLYFMNPERSFMRGWEPPAPQGHRENDERRVMGHSSLVYASLPEISETPLPDSRETRDLGRASLLR